MELKKYLLQIGPEEREAMAKTGGTSVGQLKNIAYGYRPCAPAMAVCIEKVTRGVVSRKDLRPHDWDQIWPELANQSTEQGA